MRRILTILVSAGLLFGLTGPARAQSGVTVTDVNVQYGYGEVVIFSARIEAPTPILEAYIVFQAEGDQSARIAPLVVNPDGTVVHEHWISQGQLRPFATVVFWYRVLLGPDQVYDSPPYNFVYSDNRPPWQTYGDAGVRVHWYAGDTPFGQAAFNTAQRSLQSINALFRVDLSTPIDIYIYASAADVQSVLNLGGQTWLAGHASPDLGIVLVSIAPEPGQSIEMERHIPHEMAHVLLYRQMGPQYYNLPTWLREGVATMAELYPNADYGHILDIASQNKNLIPLNDLCGPFPQDASNAILAYAQSASFVRYLHNTYGAQGLQALMDAYADGINCEQGAARALGIPLSQLDLRWRQEVLGEDISSVVLGNLAPFIVLLALVLIVPLWYMRKQTRAQEKREASDDRSAA
ncbi:MAG: hypothetical protein JXB85_10920 [Anaerolineales bacterium]|nr:hypothetical protein [Anaerolineales bacterium]